LDKAEFDRVMETNAFAPLAVTEALLENVKASQLKKIVALTTPGATFNTKSLVKDGKRAGAPEPGKEVTGKRDVTVSEGGGFYYSLSKVALNMAVHKIRPELKKDGIVFGLIAPILVDTDMLAEFGFSGPRTSAPDAVANFIKIIDGMTVETTGKPVAHDGTILDW
jgi:NAD(P)-dependent dehydrogenase (short-subunit alcohol dehydrogenase family)